ncbi:MAG: hypothetical protein AB1630_11320, partial [bacterium]
MMIYIFNLTKRIFLVLMVVLLGMVIFSHCHYSQIFASFIGDTKNPFPHHYPHPPDKSPSPPSQPPPGPSGGCGNEDGDGDGDEDGDPPEPPEPDHPDDTLDVSTIHPYLKPQGEADIAILNKGLYPECGMLLQNLEIPYAIHRDIPDLDDHSILIIPSGGLAGKENSRVFKEQLESYANQGGTIICFSQQYGEEFRALPGGLEGYGWRQDQSCWTNAAYIENDHPIFASQDNLYLTANIDGYFSEWPGSTTTLLTRTKNRMPSMLMYPFGSGTIIATTLFTDYSYARNQTTNQELKLIKDLLLFARYRTTKVYKPNEIANFKLQILNCKLEEADSVLITIDNKETQTFTLNIPSGEIGTITLTLQNQPLGIHTIAYSLYKQEEQIQSSITIDTFAVSMGLSNTQPNPDITLLLTFEGEKEERLKGTPITFLITLKNNTEKEREVSLEQWSHGTGGRYEFFATSTILPKSSTTLTYTTNKVYFWWQGPKWDFYVHTENIWQGLVGTYIEPQVNISLTLEKQTYIQNEEVKTNINLKPIKPIELADILFTIKDPNNSIIFSTETSISLKTDTTTLFSYTLPPIPLSGIYQEEIMVKKNDGIIAMGNTYFSVPQKQISIHYNPFTLKAGTNTITFNLKNTGIIPTDLINCKLQILNFKLQNEKEFTIEPLPPEG